MKTSRIAVTTDFSAESRQAFAPAAALAMKLGAELHVIHVAEIPPALISAWPEVGPYFLAEEVFDDVEKKLASLAGGDPDLLLARARPRVVRGEAIDALRDFLVADGFDLLVMASHGTAGFRRFLLGSFTERMVRRSPCPVLVHRLAEGGPPAPGHLPRRILVPHDFSAVSRPSLAAAREWALHFGAEVRLLFVAEHQASLYDYAARREGSFTEYLEKVRAEAMERFQRILLAEWQGVKAAASTANGDPGDEVIREAKEMGADWIVLGTHTRSGLERFFLGSVTQKVVRRAHCSVLVVRSQEKA